MTLDVKALAAKELAKVKLRILLFGPQVTPPSDNPYIACLQVKRETIRNELEAVGHEVLYGEDFVDPSLPPPLSNPAYQEIAVMRDADLIVVLVASPGSIGEATLIVREDGPSVSRSSDLVQERANSGRGFQERTGSPINVCVADIGWR